MNDDDWSNDASFDLANIDTSLALLPQAPGGSLASHAKKTSRPRGHRSSSSLSSRSSTSSSVGQSPLQVNSPLRHSFTRDSAPGMKPNMLNNTVEEEVDFDEGFDDAFGDDEPPARVKLSLGGVGGAAGMGQIKGARETSSSSQGSMQGILSSGTSMGVGPKGIGVITKLGGGAAKAGPSKPTNLASVRARAKAWEADLGFEDEDGFGDMGDIGGMSAGKGMIKGKRGTMPLGGSGEGLQLKLPNRPLPPPEDSDDLGFDDLDEKDARKDDDATLKAGETLKALLPPPRPKTVTVYPAPSKVAATGKQTDDTDADFAFEADIVLPLNLTNLVLATKSHPTARNHAPPAAGKGPRRSDASDTFGSISTGTNEWDEPASRKPGPGGDAKHSTPSSSRTPYSHTSVSDRLKYYSETSATSIDEPAELSSPSPSATYRYAAAETIKANAGLAGKGYIRPPITGPIGAVDPEWREDEMEMDMESGLILPDPSFFAAGAQRSKELNGILDKKRKQHYAPAPDVAASSARSKSRLGEANAPVPLQNERRLDESMEDGFVFDNPRVELSNTRLKTQRRMRGGDPHVNIAHASAGASGSIRASKRDRDAPGLRSIARSKEAGWRLQHDRAESPFTSHAAPSPSPAVPTASSRDASNPTPTPSRQMQVGSTRTRTQSAMHHPSAGGVSSMFAAPSGTSGTAGAAGTITPGRLRHQKSHHQISSVRGTSGKGGRSTSPTPLSTGGMTLLRKQSLASLQDAMQRTSTPSASPFDNTSRGGTLKATSAFASTPSQAQGGAIDGLPGLSTRDSLASIAATPSKGDRERYHASTSRLTMPTSSSRAKTRPPIAGLFSRSGLGGAESPAPSSSAAGLAALAETDPIQSRRISPPRNTSTIPVRPSTRRLVEPAQLLVPLSKRKPQASSTSAQGSMTNPSNAASTGSLGRKTRQWGDGSELEGIEDLVVDEPVQDMGSIGRRGKGGSVGRAGGIGLGRPSVARKDSHNETAARPARPPTTDDREKERRHKSKTRGEDKAAAKDASNTGSGSLRKKTKRPAMLIKHLGGVDKRKVVGEMTWNPHSLRWEGNESILASFDPPSTSPSHSQPTSNAGISRPLARPALITHLTPGSIGMTSAGDTRLSGQPAVSSAKILTSPDKDRYSTIRIVGDMQFDPQKMCWVSLVPEEDAFEGMADDEDDEWGSGNAGGTVRGSKGLLSIGGHGQGVRMSSTSTTNTHWTQGTTGTQISLATTGNHRSRGSFGSQVSDTTSPSKSSTLGGSAELDAQGQWQTAISPELWAECQAAEERHRKEVKGWCIRPLVPPPRQQQGGSGGRSAQAAHAQWLRDVQERERREGKRLWEIRNLAMRS